MSKYIIPANQAKKYKDKFEIAKLKSSKKLIYILDKFVRFMFHNIDNIALSSKGFEAKLKPFSKGNLTFNYLPQWADDLNMKLKSANRREN